jgi:hypothetical protein
MGCSAISPAVADVHQVVKRAGESLKQLHTRAFFPFFYLASTRRSSISEHDGRYRQRRRVSSARRRFGTSGRGTPRTGPQPAMPLEDC